MFFLVGIFGGVKKEREVTPDNSVNNDPAFPMKEISFKLQLTSNQLVILDDWDDCRDGRLYDKIYLDEF